MKAFNLSQTKHYGNNINVSYLRINNETIDEIKESNNKKWCLSNGDSWKKENKNGNNE